MEVYSCAFSHIGLYVDQSEFPQIYNSGHQVKKATTRHEDTAALYGNDTGSESDSNGINNT